MMLEKTAVRLKAEIGAKLSQKKREQLFGYRCPPVEDCNRNY
jgi:hypothetical protein